MTPTQAIQYLQQIASDFVQSLPMSARVATADRVNEAFKVLTAPPAPADS
jgi:hypothetical protein